MCDPTPLLVCVNLKVFATFLATLGLQRALITQGIQTVKQNKLKILS